MSSPTAHPLHADSGRIVDVVRRAADTAYRARLARAHDRVIAEAGPAEFARRLRASELTAGQHRSLRNSLRDITPAIFQTWARLLGVNARWLAIGSGNLIDPPEGWFQFGTHLDDPRPLEFSETLSPGDLLPMWERPVAEVAA